MSANDNDSPEINDYDPDTAKALGINYKLAIIETAVDSLTRSVKRLQETIENCRKAATQQVGHGEKG